MNKDLEKFINEHPETFADHEVKRMQLPTGKNDCFIQFESPNTSNGWMNFIYCNGVLTIQGDYGHCSLCWHNRNNTIETLATFANNLPYFLSKLESAEKSSIPNTYMKTFDSDLCIKEVENDFKESNQQIDLEEFEDWKYYTEDYFSWITFIREHGEQFFQDPDYWEYAFKFGEKYEDRVYLWAYGLIEAVKMLDKQKTYCPSCKRTYKHIDFNYTCELCGYVGTKDITNESESKNE